MLFVLATLGCSGLTLPEEPPSVEGQILFWTSLPTPPEEAGGVSIRLRRAAPLCDDITVSVTVTDETLVKRLPGGDLEPVRAPIGEDLAEGRTVRAWTIEPVTGCPWSGTARVVEVIVP